MIICPKVRLEDFIEVTTNENRMKYRNYIKSSHIDFLLCDSNLHIVGAIELDDNTHKKQNVANKDSFKNRLFETINIPLYRVQMSEGFYEQRLDQILLNITSNKKEGTTH